MKRCSKCGTEYEPKLAWKSKRNASWCVGCSRKYMREWMAAHPEKRRETVRRWQERHRETVRENSRAYYHSLTPERKLERKRKARDRRLKQEFGITLSDYEFMHFQQRGLCAICKDIGGKHGLSVDHNHATGKVRELLCHHCNIQLARFESLKGWADLATAYLKKHANS